DNASLHPRGFGAPGVRDGRIRGTKSLQRHICLTSAFSKSENGFHIPGIFFVAGVDCTGKRLTAGDDRWKMCKGPRRRKLDGRWFGGPHAAPACRTFRRRTTARGDRAGVNE